MLICQLREYLDGFRYKFAEVLGKLDSVLSYTHKNNKLLEKIMATLTEAIQGFTTLVNDLVSQRDSALAALTDAQARAQAAADALKQFQDDDAATDAQQLAEQAQADADAVQAALDAAKAAAAQTPEAPTTSDPIPEEPVVEPAPSTGDPADTHAAPPVE